MSWPMRLVSSRPFFISESSSVLNLSFKTTGTRRDECTTGAIVGSTFMQYSPDRHPMPSYTSRNQWRICSWILGSLFRFVLCMELDYSSALPWSQASISFVPNWMNCLPWLPSWVSLFPTFRMFVAPAELSPWFWRHRMLFLWMVRLSIVWTSVAGYS